MNNDNFIELQREFLNASQRQSFKLTTGELASLRRDGESPAFYKIAYRFFSEEKVHRNESSLRAFFQTCAIGAGLFAQDSTTGKALAASDYSEARLSKLLTTTSPEKEVIRAARFLAAKGRGHNGLGFAGVLGLFGRDLKQAKRNLASTYYRELSSKEKEMA